MQPIAQTSIAGEDVAATLSRDSGAMYARVPASTFSEATPAIPKSITLIAQSSSSFDLKSTFSSFKSL